MHTLENQDPVTTIEDRPTYFSYSSDEKSHIRSEIRDHDMTFFVNRKNSLLFANGAVTIKEAREFAKWILANTEGETT